MVPKNNKTKMVEPTEHRKERIQHVLSKRQRDLTLIIDNIHDPHNVSAILRSCDAFGVFKIYLYYTTENFPTLGRKTSASAMKWVETERLSQIKPLISKLKTENFQIAATSFSQQAVPVHLLDFTKPTAIILGNEHRGVSPELMPYIDNELHIPMQGMVQSLNVSVAAAIILYEGWKQREQAGMFRQSSFRKTELEDLYLKWIQK